MKKSDGQFCMAMTMRALRSKMDDFFFPIGLTFISLS